VPFLQGRKVWNAWAKDMSAKRKLMAASSAEDALAYLAGQCAARGQAR
jgi:hypothetical protein